MPRPLQEPDYTKQTIHQVSKFKRHWDKKFENAYLHDPEMSQALNALVRKGCCGTILAQALFKVSMTDVSLQEYANRVLVYEEAEQKRKIEELLESLQQTERLLRESAGRWPGEFDQIRAVKQNRLHQFRQEVRYMHELYSAVLREAFEPSIKQRRQRRFIRPPLIRRRVLALYVETVTGSPQWKTLTTLINKANQIAGNGIHLTVNSLRDEMARFDREKPSLTARLRQWFDYSPPTICECEKCVSVRVSARTTTRHRK
jgi:hypothetical protein